MAVGHCPFVSLSQARSKAHEVLSAVEHGQDPATTKREAAIARRQAPTFSDLLDEFELIELAGFIVHLRKSDGQQCTRPIKPLKGTMDLNRKMLFQSIKKQRSDKTMIVIITS